MMPATKSVLAILSLVSREPVSRRRRLIPDTGMTIAGRTAKSVPPIGIVSVGLYLQALPKGEHNERDQKNART